MVVRLRSATAFNRAHRQRFGYADPSEPTEVVNLRLKAVVPVDRSPASPSLSAGESPEEARAGAGRVAFQEGAYETPFYVRERLRCGNLLAGPAVVLQMDATTVIPPGWQATADPYGNLVMEPARS